MPLHIEKKLWWRRPTDRPMGQLTNRQGEYRAICLFRKLENRKKADICNYLMMSHHLLNVLHPHLHGHISETTWTWTFDNFPSRESYIGGQYSLMINVYLSFLAVLPSQLPKTLLWTKSWRKHSAIETILVIMFLISRVCNNICVWQWPR